MSADVLGVVLGLFLTLVSACVEKPKEPEILPVGAPSLVYIPSVNAVEAGSSEGLTMAASRHAEALNRRLSSPGLSDEDRKRFLETSRMTDDILEALNNGNLNEWLRDSVNFYRAGEPGSVLVTGYYTPVIEARLDRDDTFRYPVYGLPSDLITANLADFNMSGIIRGRISGNRLVPYYTREEISEGQASLAPPLMYVRDPVDLFFLHIQGSGVALLDNGKRIRLNYAAGNGRPYGSLGKALIEDGKIPASEMSMEAISRFFETNPGKVDYYFAKNPSYVFFRISEDGPFGSAGTLVTAGRTIAADSSLYPELGIAFLDTEIPVGRNPDGSVKTGRYQAIVFHQDAGSAILGPHIDLYFGEGSKAGYLAGHTRTSGTLYYLKPKA